MLLISNGLFANVTLPAVFSDGMVLQRNSEVKFWGNANPKEEITLTTGWDHKEYKTVADSMAKWEIKFPTSKEGGPYTISVKGYNEVTLKNILVGEVWLCSGQSNMEMNAGWGIENGDAEVLEAANPNIRFFNIDKATALTPQNNLQGKWEESTPETMKRSSAIAYFFAKHLEKTLPNVPVGLIISAWGGTPAEVWMPESSFVENKLALQEAQKLKPSEYGPVEPVRAFNAMINPVVGYRIAGTLWYQGESNTGSNTYENTFSELINSWRALWKYDFPFYFVQIAPYNYGEEYDGGVKVRDAQRITLKLKNTAMVVTSDISTVDDIHPKKKKEVGERLADLALKNIYKAKTGLVESPLFKNFTVAKNKIIVEFDHADGLHFKNKSSTLFEVAGEDGKFYKVAAAIKNNQVILNSKKIKNPAKVRYAWGNNIQSDLFNKAGLPASSFQTD